MGATRREPALLNAASRFGTRDRHHCRRGRLEARPDRASSRNGPVALREDAFEIAVDANLNLAPEKSFMTQQSECAAVGKLPVESPLPRPAPLVREDRRPDACLGDRSDAVGPQQEVDRPALLVHRSTAVSPPASSLHVRLMSRQEPPTGRHGVSRRCSNSQANRRTARQLVGGETSRPRSAIPENSSARRSRSRRANETRRLPRLALVTRRRDHARFRAVALRLSIGRVGRGSRSRITVDFMAPLPFLLTQAPSTRLHKSILPILTWAPPRAVAELCGNFMLVGLPARWLRPRERHRR